MKNYSQLKLVKCIHYKVGQVHSYIYILYGDDRQYRRETRVNELSF